MELNQRQQIFCDEYLISLNATEAAQKAGYKGKYVGQNADKLLKNTKIRSYIDKRMKSKTADLIASQDEVLSYLTDVLRGEAKGTVLVGQGMGMQLVQKEAPTVSERTKAAELLGKRYR